jgi:hypothetical protein
MHGQQNIEEASLVLKIKVLWYATMSILAYKHRNFTETFWFNFQIWRMLWTESAVSNFCKILVRVYQNTRCRFLVRTVRNSDNILLPCARLRVFSELLITPEF